jgi:tetratricopeptide (TPR) repeat protein
MGALDRTCLALIQVADDTALRTRLPAAFDRGRALAEQALHHAASARGGEVLPSVARAWLVRFSSAADAVGFAAELQWALLGVVWPPTLLVRGEAGEVRSKDGRLLYRGLRVKVAIHCGRIDAGLDGRWSGPGLYQAARVLSLTHGGQVLLSEAAHRVLGPPDPSITLRDLGEVALIGSDGVVRLVQALPTDLDARTFPPVPTLPTSNLHAQEESTLGRDGDVTAIVDLVRMGIRVITVVGPPGVGKSRTCRLTARALQREPDFPGGVWWVRPGEATVASLVRCLATVLSIPLEEAGSIEEAIERIGFALGARARMVVVVDHLAHRQRAHAGDGLSRDLRGLLEGWIRAARHVTFVVNTDVRFGISGEVLYVLLPLASNREDSVRLFLERARAVDQDAQSQVPAVVAELVERSGGLPLSIRLLAGIVDRFPMEQQLDAFRTGELREDRILAVVLQHLDEAEREVLAACCALPGSFELGLLVAGDEDLFPLLDRLDARGLVRRASEPEAPELLRYLVEEDVRRQVLLSLPVEEHRLVRDVRARLLLTRCEAWLGTQHERDRPELVARIAVEWEGLLEVIRIGLEEGREDVDAVTLAARAVQVLRPVLEARGPAWVAAELLDAVVRRLDVMLDSDPIIHLRVLVQRAQALRRVGRTASAFGDLERAEVMAERWSDAVGRAQCLVESGRAEYEVGSSERAVQRLEAATKQFRDIGDAGGEAVATTYLGAVQMALGRYDESAITLRRALAGLRAADLRLYEGRAIGYLAMLHRRSDDVDASRALYAEALTVVRECGVPSQESRWLAEVGLLDLNLDRVDEARHWLAEAARVARRAGDRAAEGVVLRDLGLVSIVAQDAAEAGRVLVAAVAIHRDRQERGAEGADTGLLGVAHHLQGRLDEARSSYRAASALVEEFGDARLGALFAGWLAACEAERGDATAATEALETARRHHAESGDPQVGDALELLALLVRACAPDEAFPADFAAASARMASRQRVPAFARLAWRRLTARPSLSSS